MNSKWIAFGAAGFVLAVGLAGHVASGAIYSGLHAR